MPSLHASAETALWRAVIYQAFLDACTNPYTYTDNRSFPRIQAYDRDTAREYLTTDSPDLRTVCNWASLDPSYVMMRAKRLASLNWPAGSVTRREVREAA